MLAANEAWKGGKVYVVDSRGAAVALSVVNHFVGVAYWGGFLRDADGRIVVTTR